MSVPTDVYLNLARAFISAVIAAWQTPWGQKTSERMHAPRPGDLVVETTGFRVAAVNRVGTLVREAHEPLPDWSENEGPNPGEQVFYLRTFEGVEVRWVNATVMALPPDGHEARARDGWVT